eukprot:2315418-Rhodomonas_salina.2
MMIMISDGSDVTVLVAGVCRRWQAAEIGTQAQAIIMMIQAFAAPIRVMMTDHDSDSVSIT